MESTQPSKKTVNGVSGFFKAKFCCNLGENSGINDVNSLTHNRLVMFWERKRKSIVNTNSKHDGSRNRYKPDALAAVLLFSEKAIKF